MSGHMTPAQDGRTAEHEYVLNAKRLRTLRKNVLHLSQSEFAIRVRAAGVELGELNNCGKRLVQKWESGDHAACRPNYRRALQQVFGMPFEALCQEVSIPGTSDKQVTTVAALLVRIDQAFTEVVAVREVVLALSREQEVRTVALLSRADRALSELTVVREQIYSQGNATEFPSNTLRIYEMSR
jgi:DNA-binding transcriptional regulator YiaG